MWCDLDQFTEGFIEKKNSLIYLENRLKVGPK